MKTVKFLPDNIKIQTEKGSNLLKVITRAGIKISSNCGSQGVCGKCVIKVIKGDAAGMASARLSREQINEGYRLACITKVDEDLIVEIPATSRLSEGKKVAERYTSQNLIEQWEVLGKKPDLLIEKIYLEINPPTLDRPISDLDNLKNELYKAGVEKGVELSFSALRQMSNVLRESDYKVTVSIFRHNGTARVIKVLAGNRCEERYGLAIDIGTTSVVVYLTDLNNGKICGSDSCYNSQVRHGDDVISRIVHTEEPGGLADLQELVAGDINRLAKNITSKINCDDIELIMVSGNTTMMHLFYAINTVPIREEPYMPICNDFPPVLSATGLGLEIDALLLSVPGVASYVGGDITSGVMAAGIHKSEEVNLFIDIGTNGEVVLGSSEWLMSAACSAGPCFEGSSILCGMRATEGAIEEVDIDKETFEVNLGIIGNVKPIGICGSGMIDAMANMALSGIINQKGQFADEKNISRIRKGKYGAEFVLAWKDETGTGEDIVLTEVDIENLVRAKGAIYAGMSILLSEVGMDFTDLNSIIIAGGFGKYIDVSKAKIIGLFPDLDDSRFLFLGNTSVAGAYLSLLSNEHRATTKEIAEKITNLELSVMGSFMDEYVSALFIPHTNSSAFPNVGKLFK